MGGRIPLCIPMQLFLILRILPSINPNRDHIDQSFTIFRTTARENKKSNLRRYKGLRVGKSIDHQGNGRVLLS